MQGRSLEVRGVRVGGVLEEIDDDVEIAALNRAMQRGALPLVDQANCREIGDQEFNYFDVAEPG